MTDLLATIEELQTASWTLAAVATLFESGLVDALREPRTLDELAARCDALPRERIARCLDVVATRGIVTHDGTRYALAESVLPFAQGMPRIAVTGDLRSVLMQSLAYVDASTRDTPARGWHHTNPKLLQAQGDSSAMFAGPFSQHLVHQLGDLATRLARPGARFLDVGVGVGSLSIAMCRAFPAMSAVGLDVFDVPLALARDNVARAELGDRIELRQLAVEDLRDEAAFDLAWLPACFLAPSSIPDALARVHAAVRPGGWLLMPSLNTDASAIDRAVYSMVLEQWGAVTDSAMLIDLAAQAGFAPRKLGGPKWIALVAAQR